MIDKNETKSYEIIVSTYHRHQKKNNEYTLSPTKQNNEYMPSPYLSK